MGKYTLDTDFSLLNGPKAHNWILRFRDIAGAAFAGRDNRCRLPGNLLILDQYVNTLKLGLTASGGQPSAVLLKALDDLWGYAEGRVPAADFQDFANLLYAAALARNAGEELTAPQAEFYQEHFSGAERCPVEWQSITWASGLLMEAVAIEGGQSGFEEFQSDDEISFASVDDLLAFLTDACIHLANVPLPSGSGADYEKAAEQVYQTALFQSIVEHIQGSLKTALTAAPEQYPEFRSCTNRRQRIS